MMKEQCVIIRVKLAFIDKILVAMSIQLEHWIKIQYFMYIMYTFHVHINLYN